MIDYIPFPRHRLDALPERIVVGPGDLPELGSRVGGVRRPRGPYGRVLFLFTIPPKGWIHATFYRKTGHRWRHLAKVPPAAAFSHDPGYGLYGLAAEAAWVRFSVRRRVRWFTRRHPEVWRVHDLVGPLAEVLRPGRAERHYARALRRRVHEWLDDHPGHPSLPLVAGLAHIIREGR